MYLPVPAQKGIPKDDLRKIAKDNPYFLLNLS